MTITLMSNCQSVKLQERKKRLMQPPNGITLVTADCLIVGMSKTFITDG